VSLSRPRAVVTIDGRRLTSAEAALVRLRVALGFGAHDAAELVVWPTSKFAGATAGAVMSIALGEDGDEEDVWAGEVVTVEAGADGVVIDGLASTVVLSRTRLAQTYADQSVADIVHDLVPDADEVSGDTQLPAYAIDGHRAVWAHVLDLARLVGADVGASPEGTLRFVPPRTGTADVTLRYVADVLTWTAGPARAPDVPAVGAHGAGSEAGADGWHWLLREPTAVGPAGAPVLVVPAVRTRDAADVMARALASRAARAARRGRLRLVGHPEIRPGELVEVTDLPGDPGTLRVLEVEHVLDARDGFITSLVVEGAE
jgi:hypothetical protein